MILLINIHVFYASDILLSNFDLRFSLKQNCYFIRAHIFFDSNILLNFAVRFNIEELTCHTI